MPDFALFLFVMIPLQRMVLRLGTRAGAFIAFSLGVLSRPAPWLVLFIFCMLIDELHIGGAVLVYDFESGATMSNE
jgi:hypothetical protein